MLILKIIFLTLGIMYGFTCFGRALRGQTVSTPQIFLMAIGITGFIALQWLI